MNIRMTKDLAALRASAVDKVRAECEAQRMRLRTPGDGKKAAYDAKRDEALRWTRPGNKNLQEFPWMMAELGLTADSPDELARLWLTKQGEWGLLGPRIEQQEVEAKIRIARAGSPAEIDAATRLDFSFMDEHLS